MKPVNENLNILTTDSMPSPRAIKSQLPLGEQAGNFINEARRQLIDILSGHDTRRFVVVGPCSIHDPKAGIEYAHKLKALADQVADQLLIIMRVYFEKPRTATGWKGFINDPYLDDSFRIDEGMAKGRQFLLDVASIGLPAGTEALDPIAPQYYGDLITWTAIGARTAESQTHREMASGLSTPVGFKNATDGDLEVAINGIISAASPHSFLGINDDGQIAVLRTAGNAHGHIVLRGGGGRPNYDSVSVALAENTLDKAKLRRNLVVDCSHANSWKKPELQPLVLKDIIHQISQGNTSIRGLMLESNLIAGNQKIPAKLAELTYGQSITDGCIDWADTEEVIRYAHNELKNLSNKGNAI